MKEFANNFVKQYFKCLSLTIYQTSHRVSMKSFACALLTALHGSIVAQPDMHVYFL